MVARLRPDGGFEPWVGLISTPYDDSGSTIAEGPDGTLLVGSYGDAASQGSKPADMNVVKLRIDQLTKRTDGVGGRRVR